ncbi:MAG: hypothetical protein PHS92_03060 [Candidatus Gracilibacteria bacterium]|nr:hypothetical protein [Candidatus Gracilibacteria bacterium]
MKGNIIVPSWDLVTNASVIKKFNFIPSFLSTLYLSIVVLYQIAFTYVYIFNLKDEFFSWAIQIVHEGYVIEILIGFGMLLFIYIFLTPISEGGMICLIDGFYKKDGNKYKVSYGLSRGLLNFWPIFELHNFMALFKLLSIVTAYIFCLRIFGEDYAVTISVIFFIYLIFSLIMNILFAYSKFFIIFEEKGVFEAASLSTRMTLNNMGVTGKLYFTLFLVYIRVVLTIIMFLIFPLLASLVFAYISSQFFFIFWITLIILIFIVFLLFITHFNSVLEIFIDGLWYNAYTENRKTFEMEEK